MKKILFSLLFISALITGVSQSLTGGSGYFQQQVNYIIKVTLNDKDNTLDGFVNIEYTNNSADTLRYIWFHLWPNAYKNDKTAFSDQLLENGRTDFYFCDAEKKGYINRLNFTVNGLTARLDDHPQHIDIAKLILPVLLVPAQTINISSPFHVKLPYNFSRGGYMGHSYQVTQWYPKPAVYDAKGWHPMPYLDQGEFYSEFGNFDVQITLPKDYVIAATGDLQNEDEIVWLGQRAKEPLKPLLAAVKPVLQAGAKKRVIKNTRPVKKPIHKTVKGKLPNPSSFPVITNTALPPLVETKTIRYLQNDVHDFAWFADKSFLVRMDTLELPSGRIIKLQSYFLPKDYPVWKNSLQFIRSSVKKRSEWLGEYPYNVVTAVEAKMGFNGGMEYPTITSISPMPSEKDLEQVIGHEVGHNWNYGILGSNEREHPWMDEGMNTYFDDRALQENASGNSAPVISRRSGFIKKRFPENIRDWEYRIQTAIKKDQPVESSAAYFSEMNYNLIAYHKAAEWLKYLEHELGRPVFDSSLHLYFNRWKFKHPYPPDFKSVVDEVSGKNTDSIFKLLHQKGPLLPGGKKVVKLCPLFSFRETNRYNYIFIAPAAGFNYYDKLMPGGLIHNYTLPAHKLQFFMAPLFGVQSRQLTGIGRLSYSRYSYGALQKAELSLSGASFSMDDFTDSAGNVKYMRVNKFAPALKITFRERNDRSNRLTWVQWKTFLIQEEELLFSRDTVRQIDIITYPKTSRYLNELRMVWENNRVLYPYRAALQGEQGEGFIRTTFTGDYYFNYKSNGGLNMRLFAGKFLYLGEKTFTKQFKLDRYQLNMTGANGYEDYTYSNYFLGRNEFGGLASQQIMIRDGGFKVRSDLLAAKIGKTDDWLAAVNFRTSIPKNVNPLEVLPVKIPLKIFFDVGTYAEAWEKNAATGKFIYDAGLQISLLHDLVQIYVPVTYSKVYSDYFKSTIVENRFIKNISFSFDIQHFNLRKVLPDIPF